MPGQLGFAIAEVAHGCGVVVGYTQCVPDSDCMLVARGYIVPPSQVALLPESSA